MRVAAIIGSGLVVDPGVWIPKERTYEMLPLKVRTPKNLPSWRLLKKVLCNSISGELSWRKQSLGFLSNTFLEPATETSMMHRLEMQG